MKYQITVSKDSGEFLALTAGTLQELGTKELTFGIPSSMVYIGGEEREAVGIVFKLYFHPKPIKEEENKA